MYVGFVILSGHTMRDGLADGVTDWLAIEPELVTEVPAEGETRPGDPPVEARPGDPPVEAGTATTAPEGLVDRATGTLTVES